MFSTIALRSVVLSKRRHEVLTPLAVLLLGTEPLPGLTIWWRGVSWTREYSLTSVLASRWCCSPWRMGRRRSPSPSAIVSGSGWPAVSGSNGMQMMQSRVQQVRITWCRKKPFWLWSSISGAVSIPKPALARTRPTPPPLLRQNPETAVRTSGNDQVNTTLIIAVCKIKLVSIKTWMYPQ